jgi:hypothetical protein
MTVHRQEHTPAVHRHLHMMMKSRTLFFIAIGLLILGMALFTFSTRNQEPALMFPATVYRDCAPWDGSAFRVRIPLKDGDVIDIGIWQAPDIKFSKTFSFPDDTGQAGYASLIDPAGSYEQLTGAVWFEGVSEGQTVAGRFSLKDERGEVFAGRFAAAWDGQVAMCG